MFVAGRRRRGIYGEGKRGEMAGERCPVESLRARFEK